MSDWHARFVGLADLVATWSKDPSTRVGAVIVRPDRTVASLGFNGFPRGCDDDPALYAERETKYARVVHAELNAILHAREPLHGCTMYTSFRPIGPTCDRCAAAVIQAGIVRVVHRLEQSADMERWRAPIEQALRMYEEAGVEVVQITTDGRSS